MLRTLAAAIGQQAGKEISLSGWVQARRDHGKIIFIDLRDASGLAQCVFTGGLGEELRPEWVVQVSGEVARRPENMVNKNLESGQWEVKCKDLKILSKAETPPLPLDTPGYDIDEEIRLKYRYLDLRRPRLQKNLRVRHKIIKFIRDYLDQRGFVEVETPILSKSTPEGARDYLVPARLHPGKFYALPQSPQQYKQLLMVAGLEKYYQIARCFRDEDTRGDRQPEFTQLDLEMSFVEKNDVMNLIEALYTELVKVLFPDKKIWQEPFPRFTHKEITEKYGSDKPDLRQDKNNPDELAFAWVTDFPFFEEIKEKVMPALRSSEGTKKWTFTHNPFSAPQGEHSTSALTQQYDLVLNGYEIGGGSIRAHQPEVLRQTLKTIGLDDKTIAENFGHMLEAFSFGAPPHGGIAMGLDRLAAILQNEPNIREVIAFPKTGDGRDPMMKAPGEVTKEQLNELWLDIKPSKKNKPS